MQHVATYPWVEYFDEPSLVTFWFKLSPNRAINLTPNDRNKISKITGAIFEVRRQQVIGVHGYVTEIYAAMEKVVAKLQLEMPQMLVDLLKKDEEEFGMPRPWESPVPPRDAPNIAASSSYQSAAVAAITPTAPSTAAYAQAAKPFPPRPANPTPQPEVRRASSAGTDTSSAAVTPTPVRTSNTGPTHAVTSTTAVAVSSRTNTPPAPSPSYRAAKIRTLTGRILGLASDDFVQQLMADKERWLERCLIQVITLEGGPRAALIECDRTAARIGSRYATTDMDYDNQKKLLGLCQTIYCHLRACMDHDQLPAADRVVVVKNLRAHEGHEHIGAMFYRCYDVIFKRRPPPDLSKELVACVVFRTAEQATAAVNAVDGTNLKVEPLESYEFFKEQYRWRVEFLQRLVTGEGCRPAFMRAKGCWAKTAFKSPAPPPVEQSVCADLEDDWITETLDDLESTTSGVESVAPLGDIEPSDSNSGRARLAPFPEETPSAACRVSVPHRTLTWMLYNALDHRWKPSSVKSASEQEYVRWNDEQVLHVCDSICDAHPSFFGSVKAKLRRYDRIYGGNMAYKFVRFRGDRLWERVDMFNSRRHPDILNIPRRFEWHIHEIDQAGDLLSVIGDLQRLRNHFLPVVTLDTEGCSSGERKGCRLLQLCTPFDAYLIDVWLVGDSCEFSDLMAYLFAEDNGLCRFGFHFDATPTRLSGDRKELATMFNTPHTCDQAVRQLILRARVHDVRRLVAQKKYAILDAVIPLLIVEECHRLKPTVFEAFRRMTTSATWNGAEDTDDDWWIDLRARASVAYKAATH